MKSWSDSDSPDKHVGMKRWGDSDSTDKYVGMKSAVRGHFPRFITEKGQKWLFNPILKKRYKNLPEERVRLKWVDYLLDQAAWKKSRITFEAPVELKSDSGRGRTDLLLYNNAMKPHILIECKADSVALNRASAEQASRYNSTIAAPFIILTNGLIDYYFEIKSGTPNPIVNPFKTNEVNKPRDLIYWAHRGFCAAQNHPKASEWLSLAMNIFWDDSIEGEVRYLDFKESPLPFPIQHYYRIFSMESEKRLAVTFLGDVYAGSHLVAVLNSKGTNTGILAINLNMLAESGSGAVTIISEGQSRVMNSDFKLNSILFDQRGDFIKNLHKQLRKFFD